MNTRDMTTGSPVRLILVTAIPLMLGNVFQQMYTVVDAAVVGQGVGMAALAALGSSDWFHWMWLGVVQGLAQGFAIPAAQTFGAKDYTALRRSVGAAASLGAALSVLLMLAAQLSIRPVLGFLRTPVEIRPVAEAYLRILFAGLPVVMAYNTLAATLRAFGDSRTPLIAMVIASLVNIGLDVLFVMAFRWGVNGAAIATLIAQCCACMCCLMQLRRLDFLRLHKSDFVPDRALIVRLLRLGVPVSVQNCIIAVGGMIVQTVVNPMGVTFIAGYTATNKLYGLLELAAVSYGYAMSTYAGQNLGADQAQRIRQGVRAGLVTGVVTAGIISACMFLFGDRLIGLFIEAGAEAESAMAVALEFLRLMAAWLPVLYALHVVRSALQGLGDTFVPMLSGIAEFFMRTGSALLLPGMIGMSGVFWAEVLAWLGADCVLIPGYLRVRS